MSTKGVQWWALEKYRLETTLQAMKQMNKSNWRMMKSLVRIEFGYYFSCCQWFRTNPIESCFNLGVKRSSSIGWNYLNRYFNYTFSGRIENWRRIASGPKARVNWRRGGKSWPKAFAAISKSYLKDNRRVT